MPDEAMLDVEMFGMRAVNAHRIYIYDGTPLVSATGAPQHDSIYSTSFTFRGNPTLVSRWRDTPAPAGLVSTAYSYDILGNIRTITNALNHATNFSYDERIVNLRGPLFGYPPQYRIECRVKSVYVNSSSVGAEDSRQWPMQQINGAIVVTITDRHS